MPSRLWQVAHRSHGCMPSVTMMSAYAKDTADPAAINATHARQATRSEISLGIERPLGNDLLQIGERERTHVRTIGETGEDERPVALERVRRERLAVVIV